MRARPDISLLTFVLLLVLPAVLLSAGCGAPRRLEQRQSRSLAVLGQPHRPLIVIHGFLGAKLRDPESGAIAWGRMSNIFFGGGGQRLALPLDPEAAGIAGQRLEAFQIYDSLWEIEYYAKFLRSLREVAGYQIGDLEDPRPGDNAFVFVYDWRHDNVESARRLHQAIQRLKESLGQPDLRFDLVAHSQGGLIARYYIKYGGGDLKDHGAPLRPTMAGAANVGKVILLGTPNRGCLEAVKSLHRGVKKIITPIRPEVVFTMPAVYQMLPPRGSLLFSDREGRPLDVDLYDARNWVRHGLSVFSAKAQRRLRRRLARAATDGRSLEQRLEEHNGRLLQFLERSLRRADRFHQALDAPSPRESEVEYYAFGSDCVSTLKTAIVTERRGQPRIAFRPRDLGGKKDAQRLAQVLYGPGDGTVTRQSLLALGERSSGGASPSSGGGLQFDSTFLACENHGVLANNPTFQNGLFRLLLSRRSGWDASASPASAGPASP